MVPVLPAHFHQPPLEKAPLRFLLRQFQRPFVGGSGFSRAAEPPTEISSRRVRQMIIREIAAGEYGVGEARPVDIV